MTVNILANRRNYISIRIKMFKTVSLPVVLTFNTSVHLMMFIEIKILFTLFKSFHGIKSINCSYFTKKKKDKLIKSLIHKRFYKKEKNNLNFV